MPTTPATSRPARLMRPWVHRAGTLAKRAGERLLRASEVETPAQRASRLGHVVHGEFGLRIAYDPDVISDRVIDTIERGAYERFEARRAKSFVNDGDRVVELGAGLGFLSSVILTTSRVADYQLVEADPRLPDLMRRTHSLNGVKGQIGIHTCVATCSSQMIAAGTVPFFVGKKFCASSLFGVDNVDHQVDVPVVSLPDLISEHGSNVLIADIEGAEVDLFNGTPLGGIERILMEIHPHRIGQAGVRGLFQNLDALGFIYEASASAGAVCGFRRLSAHADGGAG